MTLAAIGQVALRVAWLKSLQEKRSQARYFGSVVKHRAV